jgi:Wax ester synthase/diacylglycerol acyltransferase catalytic domain
MSAVEHLLHRGEHNPRGRSAVLGIEDLERSPDWDRLLAVYERSNRVLPRLQQKVVVPAVPTTPPRWVVDPDFDIHYHVRPIRLRLPTRDQRLAYSTRHGPNRLGSCAAAASAAASSPLTCRLRSFAPRQGGGRLAQRRVSFRAYWRAADLSRQVGRPDQQNFIGRASETCARLSTNRSATTSAGVVLSAPVDDPTRAAASARYGSRC